MRILITGAGGFIGSHMARLLAKTHKIVLLDKSSYQIRLNGLYHPILKKDLSIKRDVRGLLREIDIVIHFAAETFVDYSISNPHRFVKANILGTFNLLEEARKNPIKKFILISTDEVYGSILDGTFDEEDRLNPGNPYSATKASADMLALSYINTFKIPITILRCENNYGIYQGKEKAIPTWISRAISNRAIPIYGDGKHRRMWLRVEDFCSAISFIMNESKNEIYNVGGRIEHENIEILKMILKILCKSESLINFIKDPRPGHDRRYDINPSKLYDLGWRPKYNINNGLEEVVKWYADNQWWFK